MRVALRVGRPNLFSLLPDEPDVLEVLAEPCLWRIKIALGHFFALGLQCGRGGGSFTEDGQGVTRIKTKRLSEGQTLGQCSAVQAKDKVVHQLEP